MSLYELETCLDLGHIFVGLECIVKTWGKPESNYLGRILEIVMSDHVSVGLGRIVKAWNALKSRYFLEGPLD